MRRIVFFGTSAFAARILSFLLDHNLPIIGVVTRPDQPRGRGLVFAPSPVKQELLRRALPISLFQPPKASVPEWEEMLRALCPDLFIVVAYGEIIKKNLLQIPLKGCINIHASLLPAYRGAAPMQRALMDGVKHTGITIIEMNERMDAGNILNQFSIPVSDAMNLGDLEEKLYPIAVKSLLHVMEGKERGDLVGVPQNEAYATFAPKISLEETEIHWNCPVQQIHCQIRALSPYPGAWCWIQIGRQKKRIKIKKSLVVSWSKNSLGEPGSILVCDKNSWIVACLDGALSLLEVQLEGKKTLSYKVFLQGIHEEIFLIDKNGLK